MTLRIWSSRSVMHIIIWLEMPSSIPDTFQAVMQKLPSSRFIPFSRKKRLRRFPCLNQNFRTHRPAHIRIFPMKWKHIWITSVIPCWQRIQASLCQIRLIRMMLLILHGQKMRQSIYILTWIMRFLKTGSILPNLEAVLIPVQKRFIRRF